MRLAKTRKTYLAGALALVLMVLVFPATAGAAAGNSGDRAKQARGDIFIDEMKDFNPANGVRSGTGTARDPFVISNWDVRWIEIKNTDAHVVIRDNVVDHLTLDWIGGGVEVHNNQVGDLRVNQNRKRTGDPTSGVIENNTFEVVGQLRHFDGVFQDNVVGRKDGMRLPFLTHRRAVNFDGFNGSVFRNNTIYGYMDARLHGHHHSSGFEEASHYHGDAAPKGDEHHEAMDHTVRYHQVHIYGNKIVADHRYALAYLDTAHSANDRTAASETERTLNDPHIHYTRVFMHDNELVGAGLYVNIFNADDQLHKQGTARGLMEISDNKIVLSHTEDVTQRFWVRNGIDVYRAKDITLRVLDNTITGPGAGDALSEMTREADVAGINLWSLDIGDLFLSGNSVSRAAYGIKASDFSKTVNWTIQELVTNEVGQDVYWDSSVENPPRRR